MLPGDLLPRARFWRLGALARRQACSALALGKATPLEIELLKSVFGGCVAEDSPSGDPDTTWLRAAEAEVLGAELLCQQPLRPALSDGEKSVSAKCPLGPAKDCARTLTRSALTPAGMATEPREMEQVAWGHRAGTRTPGAGSTEALSPPAAS